MLEILKKRWFLISLAVLIPGGLAIGSQFTASQLESVKAFFHPRVVIAVVLLLMAFSLDSRQLKDSFRSPGPVLWASAVNYALIPLFGLMLMPLQRPADFQFGLMIVAAVPCTMAAASVWTRRAGGNDAVSLWVTIATNGSCFLVTPFWLNMKTARVAQLDVREMIFRLLLVVLLPTLAGQAIRLLRVARKLAVRHKASIGATAQACMLTIVFGAACEAGTRLNGMGDRPSLLAVVIVWGSCIAIHLAAMGIGMAGGRLFGFSRRDIVAVAFAGSQKTLPIAVLLATDETMFGNPDLLGSGRGVPFAVFPILMYHTSQMFIDTVIADRLAENARPAEAAVEPTA